MKIGKGIGFRKAVDLELTHFERPDEKSEHCLAIIKSDQELIKGDLVEIRNDRGVVILRFTVEKKAQDLFAGEAKYNVLCQPELLSMAEVDSLLG